MLEIFNKWYKRYLFEEESVLLLVLLTISVVLLMTIGDILAPVLASLVLAYLVQGLSSQLQRHGLPQWFGVAVSFLVFVGAFFGVTLGLLPLVWRQMLSLAGEMPRMLDLGQQFLRVLPEAYPELVTQEQLSQVIDMAQTELAGLGQTLVTRTLASIPGYPHGHGLYGPDPPAGVFLPQGSGADSDWLGKFLPAERPLLRRIWGEMNMQFANYARGKVLEMHDRRLCHLFRFAWMGLNYAALLGLLVGLSVIIPYIGAALVTLPVVLVAFFQWGVSSEFYSLFAVYVIIQTLMVMCWCRCCSPRQLICTRWPLSWRCCFLVVSGGFGAYFSRYHWRP